MDAVDRKIIAELEADGRLTVTALADRVRLSVAPCHRRLRALEQNGAIQGYRAIVDPAAIGLGFEVLLYVTMEREDAATIAKFERDLAKVAEVRHAERLFGDPDYLVRVAAADIAALPEPPRREAGDAARRAAAHLDHRDEARCRRATLPALTSTSSRD